MSKLKWLSAIVLGWISWKLIKRMRRERTYQYVSASDLSSKEQIDSKIHELQVKGYHDIVFEHGKNETCYLCSLLDAPDTYETPNGTLEHFYAVENLIVTHSLLEQVKDEYTE